MALRSSHGFGQLPASVANSLPRSVVTTKFPSSPVSSRAARLQESVGHLGVHLQRRDPRRYVQGVLVHHRLEAVVGGHRGQRGVVGRVEPFMAAVVPASGPRRPALSGHHALQHVKADWSALLERPVVSKLCSAAMLLPCAATCPSVVARAAAVARGAIAGASALLSSLEASSAVALSSRGWMAAALLPEAAVT